jgi:hypothetical protein
MSSVIGSINDFQLIDELSRMAGELRGNVGRFTF